MKKLFISCMIGLLIAPFMGCTQKRNTDTKMESLKFTGTGELKIIASATSSQIDFDFLEGKWNVQNRKLKVRLNNSTDWEEFESTLHMKKTLMGNVENYYATFNKESFEGMAIRLFNTSTRLWKIYWIDSSGRTMDEHPVTGSFENGLGKFYAKDSFNNQEIIVLYQWNVRDPKQPRWSQAFSTDKGVTWEWNWEMILTKVD